MRKLSWIGLIGLFLCVGIYTSSRTNKNNTTPSEEPSSPVETAASSATPAKPTPPSDPRIQRLPDGRTLYQAAIKQSQALHLSEDPSEDLELLAQILASYRFIFKSNPVGSENEEIVSQLLGENSLRTAFLDPEHPSLSAHGELLDRWGKPYLFHPLTSQHIELISRGPDGELWTQDDLTLEPEDIKEILKMGPS